MSQEEDENKIFKDFVFQKVRSIKNQIINFSSKKESINKQKLGVVVQSIDRSLNYGTNGTPRCESTPLSRIPPIEDEASR